MSLGVNMQYIIIILKASDGFYIASCPLLPEAYAQGKSYEECAWLILKKSSNYVSISQRTPVKRYPMKLV